MGVDLSPIIKMEEKRLEDFKGKSVALDAFNHIYQFLASIRQPDGTPLKDLQGNVTSHLSGIFYRTINLIEVGIKPIYVFDGEPPYFKKYEKEKRKKEKALSMAKMEELKDIEALEDIRSVAQRSLRLTKEMVEESKELLKAMGIGIVDAPSEGEAEAAYLAKTNKVFASSSQDYDSLLFGSPRLIRNLSITGKRKKPRVDEYVIIHPELVDLEENLKALGINREQLIAIGILVGTDFNEGVKGIGPKKALELVKKFPRWEDLKVYVSNTYKHVFEEYIDDVYSFFLQPPVKDAEIKEGTPDEEKIKEILVERHDFSLERVENAIERLKAALSKAKQSTLSRWFS